MKALRPAFLLLLLGSARPALAGLTAQINLSTLSAAQGQVITVVLQAGNNGSNSVTGVTPSLAVNSGSASLLSGPTPASMSLSPTTSGNFTYSFSITSCGNLSFTGSVSGIENASPVSSGGASSSNVSVSCPTVTPTPGPTVISPTAVPSGADAKVLGNKFHPGQGTVGFKATLPFGGTLRIHIYNRLGVQVKSIEREGVPVDNFESWDGRGEQGAYVGAGIYAVHFQGKGLNKVAKIVAIK
jgi:hypothetical protein